MCHVPVTYIFRLLKVILSFYRYKQNVGETSGNSTTHETWVIVELYSNGEKVSDIARVSRSLASVYRVIGKFQRTGSLENLLRSGRPRSIGDQEYRRLQRIVNRDRLAPLGEITARDQRPYLKRLSNDDWKKTDSTEVFTGKKLWSKLSTERNACRGVEKRGGGL